MPKKTSESSPAYSEPEWLSKLINNDPRQEASYPELGDGVAESILGDCYLHGCGVMKDYAHAAFWYRKAARQGNVGAQLALADMYVRKLVPIGEYYGYDWKEGERKEASWASRYLRRQYLNHGCKEEALYWYGKAAQRGSDVAILAVAQLEPAVYLERAKGTLWASGTHFNFGLNVEGARRHYKNISEALALVEGAGYLVRSVGWGYEIETIH